MVLSQCLFYKEDYRSISLTCKTWRTLVSDEAFLRRSLKSFSSIFNQETTVPPSLQYRFFSSYYIQAFLSDHVDAAVQTLHSLSPVEKNKYVKSEKRLVSSSSDIPVSNKVRIYYNDLIRFANLLENGQGHQTIANYCLAILDDKETNTLTPFLAHAITPLRYFRILNLCLSNTCTELHSIIYNQVHLLVEGDGRKSFYDQDGHLSTSAQKANAVNNFVAYRFLITSDPIYFLNNTSLLEGPVKEAVFLELSQILKAPKGNANFGREAFLGINGNDATVEQKWQAILKTMRMHFGKTSNRKDYICQL